MGDQLPLPLTAPAGDTLAALRALCLPLASAHARDVLARPWSAADRARTVRDGDPLGTRTEREAHADRALAYTMAVELYPERSGKYARWAAGWAALARETAAGAVVPIDLEARLRALAGSVREVMIADPARAREVLAAVLQGRVRVSQPVKRGPVWLTAEAVPGALLASQEQCTGNTGYVGDPNGKATYPVGPCVRLRRQVA